MKENSETLRLRAYRALEETTGDGVGLSGIRKFIILLIVANVVAVIFESNPAVRAAHADFFNAFELFSVAVFSLEYVVRLWGAVESPELTGMAPWKARLRYAVRPLAIVDLLAIAPFYLSFFVTIDLRYLRALRLLRLLKLSHYFPGIEMFITVLRGQTPSLAGALLVMVVLILVSAMGMFALENSAQPEQFSTLADSIWWSVVTLTTVGYGDVTPVTFGGRVLGIFIMMLGVGVVALPAAILAARFSDELQSRRTSLKHKLADYVEDGWLDSKEKTKLDQLGRDLGISEEALEKMIERARRRDADNIVCPHCGKTVDEEAT